MSSVFKSLLIGAAAFALSETWASQPGQPLDCSDWVFLEAGLSCQPVIPYPCPQIQGWPGFTTETLCVASDDHRALDNAGRRLWVRRVPNLLGTYCGLQRLWRLELVVIQGSSIEVLAYMDDRCYVNDPNNWRSDLIAPQDGSVQDPPGISAGEDISTLIKFDPLAGELLVTVRNQASDGNVPQYHYEAGLALWKITGFATLFEVLQTYTPTSDALGFRVPAHPEGLRAADHFDTYWGRVSDLPDFTKAQPMACDYPAAPPAVGTYLTVADNSPVPAPGKANYTVTAVNYGAERRYGRKLVNGVMSGRDPAILPACP